MNKKLNLLLFVLLMLCTNTMATDLMVNVAEFGANPAALRNVTLQPLQPFYGMNLLTFQANSSGIFYYSNAPVADYVLTIKSIPGANSITAQVTVTATNLGTIDAFLNTSQLGVNTYPVAGQASWTIEAADSRYQFSGTTLSNTFYPLFSNPSNYVQLPFLGTIAFSNANSYINTNALPGLTNAFVGPSITNGLATIALLNTASNFLANNTGVSLGTATNVASSIYQQSNANLSAIIYSNPATYINMNQLPGLTNGLTPLVTLTNATNAQAQYNLQTYALSNGPTINGPLNIENPTSSQGAYFTNASGAMEVFLSTGSPLEVLNFQVYGYSTTFGLNVGSNYIWSPFVSGNGGGGPASGALSNAWTTNLTGAALLQGTNIALQKFMDESNGLYNAATNGTVPIIGNLIFLSNSIFASLSQVTNISGQQGTNAANNQITNLVSGILTASNYQGAINTSSNGGWGANTNFADLNFVFQNNGGSTNQTVWSSPIEMGTNTAIGLLTNNWQSTNLVAFSSCGSPGVTNGIFVWTNNPGIYTNWTTGAWITNNGSVWQLFSQGRVQLFSHNILNGAAGWTLQAGAGTAFSDYGYYTRLDFTYGQGTFTINGSIVINGSNIFSFMTNIASANGGGNATNAINNLGGFGTNTIMLNVTNDFTNANWGLNSTFSDFVNPYQYNYVLSGHNNSMLSGLSRDVVIVSGSNNTFQGSTTSYGFIGGGRNNTINGLADNVLAGGNANQIFSASQSVISGGAFNNITGSLNLSDTIPGGISNTVYGSYNTAGGYRAQATNNNSFVWSDGRPITNTANSQVIFQSTNGFLINTNSSAAANVALEVLGNIDTPLGITATAMTNNVTSLTNLVSALGGGTNMLFLTNVVWVYQAGTSLATPGSYLWNSVLNVFTNPINNGIITNTGSAYNLQTNGTTLYSSATLINSAWGAVAGAGTASSRYGGFLILDGLVVSNFPASSVIGQLTNNTTGHALQDVLATNGTSFGQVISAPTNMIGITVSYGGTNITFRSTNNTYGNVIVLSNALYTATNLAWSGLANGGDSNVVVTMGPGIWLFDAFNNSGQMGPSIVLPQCVTLLGSGTRTVLTYTNNTQNDSSLQITPNGEFGNLAMNFYIGGFASDQTGAQNYHDITFPYPLWNAANFITNGVIDGFFGQFSAFTNIMPFTRMHINGTYDAVNLGYTGNLKSFVRFKDCDLTEQTYTNSTSLVVRDLALFQNKGNLTVELNGCLLTVREDVTNSPYLAAGTQTNDASCIEFGAGSKNMTVYMINSKFQVVSNNTTGWPINFGGLGGVNACGTNAVVMDAYTSLSLNTNLINWALSAGSKSNAVIFTTPPGWTNYIQDGTWIHNP